jgi:replicative DNA helicase
MSYDVVDKSYHHDPDIFDLIDGIENDLANLQSNVIRSGGSSYSDAKTELYEKTKAVEAGEPPGIFTGLWEFDDWCGGFQKRELITIAARPGMGKTTAILSICAKASFDKNIPVAFFSLEMAEADLKARLAARGLQIDYEKIRQGKLEASDLHKVIAYYDFIDKSKLTIVDRINRHQIIIKKIRDLVQRNGVKMVVIDYVQLIKLSEVGSGDRTGELNVITRDLKALANELNIPIIIVAQLSRGVDNRSSKRPILSDLKQSGSIEEDSDTVIFLLRMAYYEQELGKLLPPHIIGKTEFIVAKGRHIGVRNFWTYLDFNNYDFRSE